MRFTAAITATFAVAILTCAAADGSAPARSATAPPCIPKVGTVSGHEVVSYCGPATATITIGKKTYSFKNGYCRKDTKNSIPLSLTLGEIVGVHSPVNGGQPLFEMTVLAIGKLMSAHVNADSGGKVLDSIGTVELKGSFPSSGTFTSSGLATPHFTGSWKCNGPLYTP
jgi:hypothetical protein